MKKIMLSIVNHPFVSIAILAAITAIFCIPLPRLFIDPSTDGMMISDDPDRDYYEEVKEVFGDDVLIAVSITSDNIFREEILQSVENLSDKIHNITLDINGENRDVVTRVISLTTVTNIVDQDGVLDASKLIEYVPSKPDELETIRKNSLQNEIYLNDIISKDGKTTTINAYIKASPPRYLTYNQEITNRFQEIIDIEKEHLKKQGVAVEIFQIGFPVVKVKITEFIDKDMRRYVPICILVSLIILWFSFRSLIAVIIPIVTGTISVVWTLGFMAFMGYSINELSHVIPILLIVIGCTEDIHMLSEYSHQIKSGNEKLIAIRNMAVKCGLAIFLTSLTTILGFTALTINKIIMVKEFGICASVGLAFNFVVTILFIPSFFRWVRVPKSFKTELNKKRSLMYETIVNFFCHVAFRKRKFVLIGVLIITTLAIIGTLRVNTDSDYVSFFKKNSDIRVKLDKLHERVSGGKSFLIVVDTGQVGGIKNPEIMSGIAKLQHYLNKRFDKTLSVADYIKTMHREMNNGNKEFFKIPDSKELIAQYLLMIDSEDMERLLESTCSKACIVVRHNIVGSWQVKKKLEAINDMSKQLFPEYVQVRNTGVDILYNKSSDYMARGQALSLGLAMVLVFIIISLLFFSLKVGFLAMIPNAIPILLNFGIMGLFGIPLNPSTSVVAVIALGIAVDDTIHLMVRFHKELKSTNSQNEAMVSTIRNELLPIMSTSIALAIGFSILLTSNFVSNLYFGCLAAIVMLVALVSDLLVTPGLLIATQLFSSRDTLKAKFNEK